jgi:hypothetical protein
LLLLLIQLSSLGLSTLPPTEGAGAKKVCLRKGSKGEHGPASQEGHMFRQLFEKVGLQPGEGADRPSDKHEFRSCAEKQLYTLPTLGAAGIKGLFPYQEPGFLPAVYFFLRTAADPDPPRLGCV